MTYSNANRALRHQQRHREVPGFRCGEVEVDNHADAIERDAQHGIIEQVSHVRDVDVAEVRQHGGGYDLPSRAAFDACHRQLGVLKFPKSSQDR